MPNEKPGWFHLPKRHKKIYFTILVIIVGAAIYFWPRPPAPIETQKVVRKDIIESISSTGTIDTRVSVDLSFAIPGKLVYLGVKKGDMVKKGATIGVLDQRTVQKNLENTLRDFVRQRYTYDKTLDDNQNRTPETALNYAMQKVLRDNQYDLEKSVVSVELQDLAKQQTVLTSPIDGILLDSDAITTGVNITTATKFTVADAKNLVFKIDIDEADIGKIKNGQNVKVKLDAYPDRDLNLPVKSIDFSSHTNSTGGNVYSVEVDLPVNSDLSYRIGMNGDAEIVTNEVKDVKSIPLSSVDDNQNVFVKTAKGFVKRKIVTGLQNDTEIEVVSGVNEGEEVALDPGEGEKLVVK